MPPPQPAVERYARAVESQQVELVWSMMSSSARQDISKAEMAELLAANHAELLALVQELKRQGVRFEERAVLFLDQGEDVELVLEAGQFRIRYQELLPGPAQSPHEALERLRRALARRDYPGLLSLLDPKLRSEVEGAIETIEAVVSNLDEALLDVRSDRATVTLPGGRMVQLKRTDQVWFITELP